MAGSQQRRPANGYKRGGKQAYHGSRTKTRTFAASGRNEATSADEKREATKLAHSIDEAMGFARYEAGRKKQGWLVNLQATELPDENNPNGRSALDLYFLEDDGGSFKATIEFEPYFLVAVKRGYEPEAEEWLKRVPGDGCVKSVKRIEKEDLSMPNHLMGYRRTFLELRFQNQDDLMRARRDVIPIAEKNKKKVTAMDTYAEVATANAGFDLFDDEARESEKRLGTSIMEASEFIVDVREWDVPYHVRVLIDKDIRVGKWYEVEAKHGVTSIHCLEDRLARADPVVMAYDIETTKLPLKFPDASIDQIMMISYMIDGQGFLITNREIVSEDIDDFDYTPKPEYDGPFMIFNEPDEKAVIERFFLHIKEARPTVIATYNGDFFDWPFVDARASVNGIDMYQEIGWRKDSEDQYQCDYSVHMDCFHWVNRDSYLPQGSRGLKAVTVAKLGYDPDELDPELMTRYAAERPQTLAEYSVSDAVATYYLYMKYVHPFIFSLCTIIPLGPDAVLRKGTGTLCEMLLMVQAYQKGIVLPNKHKSGEEKFFEGHLLETETYVGGHVEALEAGVFRADIPYPFKVDTTAIDELLEQLDAALKFTIEVEEKKDFNDVTNYEEVKKEITDRLMNLKNTPQRMERPLIYHLDVASMYPNIMTTNRLQPDSMIDESDCAACDFNRPGKTCDRRLPWTWRGEFIPAKKQDYNQQKRILMNETFPGKWPTSPRRKWTDLSPEEQLEKLKVRLRAISQKEKGKVKDTKETTKTAIICQRENPFYIDTVKDFRDRRYDYKGKQKVWKNKTDDLKKSGASQADIENGKKMIVLFDSLQLAHKVILNSFYGYVMRKGSRWYSMEMAGVTCLTGAHIIQMARKIVERVGRPLELDTDGIWCMLPATFPENFSFKLNNGKKFNISYPCTMLNHLVHQDFTNHQYQTLVDPISHKYATHSDNTIFFEVDGPYRAMVLPTSKEEDKNLKKRYAVFNHDGSLAELKGFEVKRRGELKLIKIFQQQIFKFFLEGTTLKETYAAVAKVADRWLDVLYSKGSTLADEELIDLICENRSMSKTLAEYGTQKSTSITTAKRLADFLGEQMVKDKGLNCKYIICAKPKGAPVTERAIPVAIFSAEESTKRYFLRKWLKEDPTDMDPRALLDWDYYTDRLGSVIQKLITIPAGYQKIDNPVPRIAHPEWLQKRIRVKLDPLKQKKMTDLGFVKKPLKEIANPPGSLADIEEMGTKMLKPAANMIQELMSTPAATRPQKRKSPEPAVPVSVDPFAALPKVMPDPSKDYVGFIEYQKQKWTIQKQARARRRHLFGDNRPSNTSDIAATFRQKAEDVYRNTWHVLQFRQTDIPGQVLMHVLIDHRIHTIKMNVPRQVFLNMKGSVLADVEIDGCVAQKVTHTLPNGHPSVHLFRLEMPEETYVNEAQKLSILFNHPNVEGVYEKTLPLTVRALLKLGTMCTFDESVPGVLGKGLEQGFDLDSLKAITPQTEKRMYLQDSGMAYLYIYHVIANDRQVFAVISSTKDQAHVVVLKSSKDNNQELPNIGKVYSDQLRLEKDNPDSHVFNNFIEYQDKMQFTTKTVTTRRKALLEIGDLVKKIKNEESKPLMLAIQSPQTDILLHDVPALSELPLLSVRYDKTDASFPPLGWQTFVVKKIVRRYQILGWEITRLHNLAIHGNIPMCNLQHDDTRFLIDVAYARKLQEANVVLWWSDGPRPDHAGHEKDDVLGPLETVDMPFTNLPGTYSSVCIEISVGSLVTNTILTSAMINELEGADGISFNPTGEQDAGNDNGAAILSADNTFAGANVKVLRQMVREWWQVASDGHEEFNDLVRNLTRWVESPNSFMYDRALHYYVQTMSKKAFQQLLADFKRVGCKVVFANPTKIVLQTTKNEIPNAAAYSNYIIQTIKAKPLFSFLTLNVTEYWDFLAWYDEYNYGGKACSAEAATRATGMTASDLTTPMEWQMQQFLPVPMQNVFHDWVVKFIDMMHAAKKPNPADPHATPRATLLPVTALTKDREDRVQLPTDFEKPLKKEIARLIRSQKNQMLHPELAADLEFPQLPGSHLKMHNPALQLVKYLMQVLSLDTALNISVRLLRKELLALFEVREFSGEATFVNPSTSLKIPQLSCDTCTAVRDLDLCRDADVLPEPGQDPRLAADKEWTCNFVFEEGGKCEAPFSRTVIEERLVADLEAIVVQWACQDVKCGKCGGVRINDFMEHCGCSGNWVGTISREEIGRRLGVYERVGSFYQLPMLSKVVEELMSEI